MEIVLSSFTVFAIAMIAACQFVKSPRKGERALTIVACMVLLALFAGGMMQSTSIALSLVWVLMILLAGALIGLIWHKQPAATWK